MADQIKILKRSILKKATQKIMQKDRKGCAIWAHIRPEGGAVPNELEHYEQLDALLTHNDEPYNLYISLSTDGTDALVGFSSPSDDSSPDND